MKRRPMREGKNRGMAGRLKLLSEGLEGRVGAQGVLREVREGYLHEGGP